MAGPTEAQVGDMGASDMAGELRRGGEEELGVWGGRGGWSRVLRKVRPEARQRAPMRRSSRRPPRRVEGRVRRAVASCLRAARGSQAWAVSNDDLARHLCLFMPASTQSASTSAICTQAPPSILPIAVQSAPRLPAALKDAIDPYTSSSDDDRVAVPLPPSQIPHWGLNWPRGEPHICSKGTWKEMMRERREVDLALAKEQDKLARQKLEGGAGDPGERGLEPMQRT